MSTDNDNSFDNFTGEFEDIGNLIRVDLSFDVILY